MEPSPLKRTWTVFIIAAAAVASCQRENVQHAEHAHPQPTDAEHAHPHR